MRRARVLVASATLAVSIMAGLMGMSSPTLATGQDGAEQLGQVTLFERADFTGWKATINYVDCQEPQAFFTGLRTVSAFENRPLPGCRVTLIGESRIVLCAGRGTVPPQTRPIVLIEPGATQPCW
jgi:hypothetical protein